MNYPASIRTIKGSDGLVTCRCPSCGKTHYERAWRVPPKADHVGGPYVVICPKCSEDGAVIGR